MSAPACVCAVRGYCADVPGDPHACPGCVQLAGDEPCLHEEGGARSPVVDLRDDNLLDVRQVAELLGFDADLLATWQRRGAGPRAAPMTAGYSVA